MTELTKYDFEKPCLDPQDVCNFLGIKGNYLGHEVQVTIGAPSLPPEKRGQKAGYSSQDAILIWFGRQLIQMGITPSRCPGMRSRFQGSLGRYSARTSGNRLRARDGRRTK